MYVGIYDMDIFEVKYTFKPSLEVMQLSAYHRKNNDIVELILDLEDLSRFNKIYLVKNHLNTNFPADLISDPRVELIGLGFTNGIYVENFFDKIEPDKYIYNKFLEKFSERRRVKKTEKVIINDLQRCGYTRLYYKNGLNPNLPSESRIYLYDNTIDNNGEGLNLINSKNYSIIKLVNNISSENLEELIKWASNKWNFYYNQYILSREITDKEFLDYIKIASNLKVPIYFQVGDYSNGTTSKLQFKLWMHRSIYARAKGVKLNLSLKENKLDYYNDLFRKLKDWNNLGIKEDFYSYFPKIYPVWKDTFELMLKKNKDIELLVKTDIRKIINEGGIYLYDR